MATTRSGARRPTPAGDPPLPALPKVTVARFEDAGALLERLYDENVDIFIARGQDYRDRHREATTRPLEPEEVGAIAAGLGTTLADAQEQIEAAGLVQHETPSPNEVLLAAGLQTAPAFMRAVRRVVALIELDPDVYNAAREQGDEQLWQAIDDGAATLRELDLEEARQRAQRALEHLAGSAGVSPGKAWGLVAKTVWQAMSQAALQLGERMRSESSMSSAASTAGSPASTSSTSSGTPTPAS